jgi:hypothetical protein
MENIKSTIKLLKEGQVVEFKLVEDRRSLVVKKCDEGYYFENLNLAQTTKLIAELIKLRNLMVG